MKKYFTFLILLCLLCISGTALAQSGRCGVNYDIEWTLENGTITFNGTGDHPTWSSTCKNAIRNATRVVVGQKIFAPTNVNRMFENLSSVQEMILDNLDVSEVTDMSFMFYFCRALTSIKGLSSWDTSNVTNMSYMFNRCSSAGILPVSQI